MEDIEYIQSFEKKNDKDNWIYISFIIIVNLIIIELLKWPFK